MNSIFNNLGADNTTTKAIIIMGCICAYMLPFIVAFFRGNENRHKWFWVNLLLGWTVVMWILCLVKILKEPKGEIFKEDYNNSNEEDKNIIRSTETNIYNSSNSSIDTNTKPIKIRFGYCVFGILAILALLLFIVTTVANSQSLKDAIGSTKDSVSSNITSDTTSNKNAILDVIDEDNQEFKINGIELVEAIDDVYKSELGDIRYGYKDTGVAKGIRTYGISSNILSVRDAISFPAILISIREKTGNVVGMTVCDPYKGDEYYDKMLVANFNHLIEGIKSLGYTELSNTIEKIFDEIASGEQSRADNINGLNGVYVSYLNGLTASSIYGTKYGTNYYRFTAMDINIKTE